MPYIDPISKSMLEFSEIPKAVHAGELNYQITSLIIKYLDAKGLRYATINDIVGALEGAKLEFYRRVAVPYENNKIHENGDVYPAKYI